MMETVGGSSRTRWEELREIVKIVVTIGSIFDTNGVNIRFLNRKDRYTIKGTDEINELFAGEPKGYTPLVRSVREILKLPVTAANSDRKLLLFIATDGYPTDANGVPNLSEFENVMRNERNSDTTYVSFLMCTDNQECVDYLSNFSRTMTNVDVTGNFNTERMNIRKERGAKFPFSKGDYITKVLVGAVNREKVPSNEPDSANNS
ncbi:unnamed protein product [Rotaria magnacalcarata]|uniref:VWFA domain-containing protein n=1 Tax=Rotaria magnacalcarata TaxID=392030 RepID=A0A816MJW5_9BILA|nr:unnamed protein product [Rotaria magnacalcarata]CAF4330198.1 unnamed protein product [Rotaria magnacalcarata]